VHLIGAQEAAELDAKRAIDQGTRWRPALMPTCLLEQER